jgi:hypothetical protein
MREKYRKVTREELNQLAGEHLPSVRRSSPGREGPVLQGRREDVTPA